MVIKRKIREREREREREIGGGGYMSLCLRIKLSLKVIEGFWLALCLNNKDDQHINIYFSFNYVKKRRKFLLYYPLFLLKIKVEVYRINLM